MARDPKPRHPRSTRRLGQSVIKSDNHDLGNGHRRNSPQIYPFSPKSLETETENAAQYPAKRLKRKRFSRRGQKHSVRSKKAGWGGWIRTSAWRYQKPLPYHLATPQCAMAFPPIAPIRGQGPAWPGAFPHGDKVERNPLPLTLPHCRRHAIVCAHANLLRSPWTQVRASPCP